MSKTPKRIRRTFSDEFKQDTVNLVVNHGYLLSGPFHGTTSSSTIRGYQSDRVLAGECCQFLADRMPYDLHHIGFQVASRNLRQFVPPHSVVQTEPHQDRFSVHRGFRFRRFAPR